LRDLSDQIDPTALSAVMPPSLEACVTALVAFMNGERGNEDEARRGLDRLSEQAVLALPRDEHWITTMALLADTSVQVRDGKRAALFYDLLLPYAEQNLAHDLMRSYLGSTHHYLARLATCLDRFDQAETHYESALRFNRDLGAAPLVARTQAAWGQWLRSRGRAKDRRRAGDLLEQAHTTAIQLGMRDLARRTEDAE
jgi:tetratricopeptide (TPR) repeat protein